jgi:hypothetical protein
MFESKNQFKNQVITTKINLSKIQQTPCRIPLNFILLDEHFQHSNTLLHF